jgi:hypothetical protein
MFRVSTHRRRTGKIIITEIKVRSACKDLHAGFPLLVERTIAVEETNVKRKYTFSGGH